MNSTEEIRKRIANLNKMEASGSANAYAKGIQIGYSEALTVIEQARQEADSELWTKGEGIIHRLIDVKDAKSILNSKFKERGEE